MVSIVCSMWQVYSKMLQIDSDTFNKLSDTIN